MNAWPVLYALIAGYLLGFMGMSWTIVAVASFVVGGLQLCFDFFKSASAPPENQE